MKRPTILIAGGAGYIGAHVVYLLKSAGYPIVVVDNLSRGALKAIPECECCAVDIGDFQALAAVFKRYPIQAVIHLAAFTDIGASIKDPLSYYQNNVANTLTLLQVMRQFAVKHLLFSSSAGIYGYPQEIPIAEDSLARPVSPYGRSKLMVEEILADCLPAYGIQSVSLRYFNAAGAHPEGKVAIGRRMENNLIPILLNRVLQGKLQAPIFGTDYLTPDGTCVRDFLHVVDLAEAHRLALEWMLRENRCAQFNLGNGKGFSVLQVVQAIEEVTGVFFERLFLPRRIGDPPVLVADAQKAQRLLKWRPIYADLKAMVAHQWQAICL